MSDAAAFRTKWMDPDFRRDAKTGNYCCICQRDLKAGQAHRSVLFQLATYEAVHSEDWLLAVPEGSSGEGFVIEPIGMDCAKHLGLEWSQA